MEEWKTITWGDGKYQVNRKGVVRNGKTGRILVQTFYKNYYQVTLWTKNTCKCFRVHRLVAEAFIPNPFNLPCVNHKDENTRNNSVENLEWCDVSYNNNYGTRKERCSKTQINSARLSKEVLQYSMDGSFIRLWPSGAEAERQLGIAAAHIYDVCSGALKTNKWGRKWVPKTAGGFIWRYYKRKEVI